jgi:hypothetical protein
MNKRQAQIVNSQVINVIIWDGDTNLDLEGELIELEEGSPVGVGYTYDGVSYTPPATTEEQLEP